MVRKTDVEGRAASYLRDEIELQTLREWMLSVQLDEQNLDPAAKALAEEFEGWYAEFSDGLTSESSFRNHLRSLTDPEFPANNFVTNLGQFFNPVNQLLVGAELFPKTEPSGTSAEVVFGSIHRLQP